MWNKFIRWLDGGKEQDIIDRMKATMQEACDLIDEQQEEILRLQRLSRVLYNHLNEVREHGECWGD